PLETANGVGSVLQGDLQLGDVLVEQADHFLGLEGVLPGKLLDPLENDMGKLIVPVPHSAEKEAVLDENVGEHGSRPQAFFLGFRSIQSMMRSTTSRRAWEGASSIAC